MDFRHTAYTLLDILNQMSPYVLLGFFIAGLLHVFIKPRTMSRHLSGTGWRSVIKAALFGIPLPLCSCGVLPAAVSLRRQGASKAAATSFLIATPQTGVDSIAATYSLLGLPFAMLRPVGALVGAFAGGMAVGRFGDDTEVNSEARREDYPYADMSFIRRLWEALRYGMVDMVASVGKWLVIGLVVAALITVFVPDSLFVAVSEYPLLAMLAVLIVAVPMYICATGSIPVALSLMMKGLSPGIAFVMLMAGPAANFASIMVLTRTYGRRATAIYVASVAVTAIVFGLCIDMLLPRQWFAVGGAAEGACHHAPAVFDSICSVILVALLVYAAFSKNSHQHKHNINETNQMTRIYKITGMACAHCKANVERTLAALEGVESCAVDLSAGTAEVEGTASPETVAEAVRLAGYECDLL